MEQVNHTTKRLKWKQIDEKTRYKIEALLESGHTVTSIAIQLGYSRRTIGREIKRGTIPYRYTNPSYNKYELSDTVDVPRYLADVGQRLHLEAGTNKGPQIKLKNDYAFQAFVESKVAEEHWSPDAIIHYQRQNHLFQTNICVKTLYNYIDKKYFSHITNKDLLNKSKDPKRKKKRVSSVALNNRSGLSIEERPDQINQRQEMGHWEMDLVVGKKHTQAVILTLVERVSRKSIYVLLKNKTQEEVVKGLKKARKKLGECFKSITTDNGSEFLNGEAIKHVSGCKNLYYAHPYCSWEKGSNENGNRILRRFFHKGTDLSNISAFELQKAEDWVNNYPRRVLNYKTANEIFYA